MNNLQDRIIFLLREGGPSLACPLATALGVPTGDVTRILRSLVGSRTVSQSYRTGRWVYALAPENADNP